MHLLPPVRDDRREHFGEAALANLRSRVVQCNTIENGYSTRLEETACAAASPCGRSQPARGGPPWTGDTARNRSGTCGCQPQHRSPLSPAAPPPPPPRPSSRAPSPATPP